MGPQLKELLGTYMVGDGVVALLAPRRHSRLWSVVGPGWFRRMNHWTARHPQATRAFAAVEVGLGALLIARQFRRALAWT